MVEDPNVERLIKEAIKPLEKKMIELEKIMQDTDIKPLSFKKSEMNKLLKPIEDLIRNLEQTRFLDKYDSFSQAYLDMQLKNSKRSICILRGKNPDELLKFKETDLLKDFIEVHFDNRIKKLINILCECHYFDINKAKVNQFSNWGLNAWKQWEATDTFTAVCIYETFQKHVIKP